MRTGGVAEEFSGGESHCGRKRGFTLAFTMGQQAGRPHALVGWAGDTVSKLRLLLQRGQVSGRHFRERRHGFLDAGVDLVLDRFHGDADRVADCQAG